MSTRRRILLALAASLVVVTGLALVLAWESFGGTADGGRLARMQRSPQWHDGGFENPEPLQNDTFGMFEGMLHASDHASPRRRLRIPHIAPTRFASPPSTGVRVTWLGHSTSLVEVDGVRVLVDPVWSDRTTPISFLGPSRFYSPPIALAELPRIDAVVVSHDHYDHLDMRTVKALARIQPSMRFVVPLGIGAHLESWGIAPRRIDELDWWESVSIGGASIVCTPARHASGRSLVDYGDTLWAGFAILGPAHRVYYSGDTGLFRGMRAIGERLGPFDLAMIEVGQYHRSWPDWHVGPEQAVEASVRVRARALLPVHWGQFALAYHAWTEPVERVRAEADRRGVSILTPRPGESVEPTSSAPTAVARWWPRVPWQTGSQAPIVSHDAD